MSTPRLTRTLISSVIGILVILLVIASLPKYDYKPQGLLLPAKIAQKTPLTPDQVSLYPAAPIGAKVLGMIQIERHFSLDNTQAAQDEIINKAKELAASAGANGVYIRFIAHSTPNVTPSAQSIYKIWAYAIYTPVRTSALSLSIYDSGAFIS